MAEDPKKAYDKAKADYELTRSRELKKALEDQSKADKKLKKALSSGKTTSWKPGDPYKAPEPKKLKKPGFFDQLMPWSKKVKEWDKAHQKVSAPLAKPIGDSSPAGRVAMAGISKASDIISRPLYATAGVVDEKVKEAIHDKNPLKTLINNAMALTNPTTAVLPQNKIQAQRTVSGLAGTNKDTYVEVLKHAGVNPQLAALGGTALNIVGDPVGPLSFEKQGLTGAERAGQEALKSTDAIQQAAKVADTSTQGVGVLSAQKKLEAAKAAHQVNTQSVSTLQKALKKAKANNQPRNIAKFRTQLDQAQADAAITRSAIPQAKLDHAAAIKIETKASPTIIKKALQKVEDAKNTPLESRTISVNYGKGQVAEIPAERLLAAVDKAKENVLQYKVAKGVAKRFSTKVEMPLGLDFESRRVVNGGLRAYEEAAQKHLDFGKLYSPEDRRLISHAYEQDGGKAARAARPELGKAFDYIEQRNKEIYDAEVKAGYRNPDKTPYDPHYMYHTMPGGEKLVEKKAFKAERKAKISKTYDPLKPPSSAAMKGHTLQDAVDLKLHPLQEFDNILAAREAKLHSDMSYHTFVDETLKAFGVKPETATAAKIAERTGLVKYKDHYIHPEAKVAIDHLDTLRADPRRIDAYTKLTSDVMNLWKLHNASKPGAMATNALGDIHTNYVSGVDSVKPYYRSTKILTDPTGTSITLGGTVTKSGEEIYRDFLQSGTDTGQLRVENSEHNLGYYSPDNQSKTGYIIGRMSAAPGAAMNTKAAKVARSVTEGRETWNRLAKYVDVLDKQVAKGVPYEQAVKIATKETLKWTLDYSALTQFEKTLRRGVMPYYTFFRKSTPLMLNAMLTRPGRMNKVPLLMSGVEKFLGTGQDTTDVKPKGFMGDLYQLTKNMYFDDKLPATEAMRLLNNPTNILTRTADLAGPQYKVAASLRSGRTLNGSKAGSTLDQLTGTSWFATLVNDLRKDASKGTISDRTKLEGVRAATGLGLYQDPNKAKTSRNSQEVSKLKKQLQGGK